MPDGRRARFSTSAPVAVVLPALATLGLFVFASFYVVLPDVAKAIVESKRREIRDLTAAATSLLEQLALDAERGHLTRQQAQAEAIRRLRLMRYGPEKKDYFWVHGLDGYMVMHPYRPDLEGTDVLGWTDPTGKRLFSDMIDLVNARGEGYVEYRWQHKDERNRVVPKLSYVVRFEPWRWVVGTGVYMEELDAEIAHLTARITWVSLAVLGIVSVLSAVLIWNAGRVEIARRKATELLATSEERYRLVAENIGDVVWTTDAEHRLSYVSPSIARVAGFEASEALKLGLGTFLSKEGIDEVAPAWREALAGAPAARGRTFCFEHCLARKGGGSIWIETNLGFLFDAAGRPVGLLGTSRDIDRRKIAEDERARLEQQLLQAQKLEALGTLAGGIAHDFNNVLSTILSYSQLASQRVDPAVAADLKLVLQAAQRARDLVRQILTFGKRIDRPLRSTRLQPIVEDTAALLRARLGKDQRLDLQLDVACGPVLADPTQLHQVVMNLATNALHALEERGGTVEVRLDPVGPGDPAVARFPDLAGRQLVRLTVSDTGCGMSDETRARIFDPFFTTKPVGKGTGLGLSVVHGVVTSHGGRIEVESELGRGSSFRVLLPCTDVAPDEAPTGPQAAVRGQERILLVDDEPTLARFVAQQLEELGYRVTSETSAVCAMRRFREAPASFDLLLTDQLMPEMTGVELVRELRGARPDVRAVLMTGGTRDALSHADAVAMGIREVILKPATIEELTAAIRRALAP